MLCRSINLELKHNFIYASLSLKTHILWLGWQQISEIRHLLRSRVHFRVKSEIHLIFVIIVSRVIVFIGPVVAVSRLVITTRPRVNRPRREVWPLKQQQILLCIHHCIVCMFSYIYINKVIVLYHLYSFHIAVILLQSQFILLWYRKTEINKFSLLCQ